MATNQKDKIDVDLRLKVRQVQRAAGPEHDTYPSECAGTSRQQEPANPDDEESEDEEELESSEEEDRHEPSRQEGSKVTRRAKPVAPDKRKNSDHTLMQARSRDRRRQPPSSLGETKPRYACKCSSKACSGRTCGCKRRGLKCCNKCSCIIAGHCMNPLKEKPN